MTTIFQPAEGQPGAAKWLMAERQRRKELREQEIGKMVDAATTISIV